MRTKGLSPFSANLEPRIAEPLDARVRVPLYSDLTSTTSWQSGDSTVYLYKGIIVAVTDDPTPSNNGVYVLKDTDYTNIANWEKLGSGGGSVPEPFDYRNLLTTSTANIYVDGVNGNDTTGDGTELNPYQTIEKAISSLPPVVGDLRVLLRGYTSTTTSYTLTENFKTLFAQKRITGLCEICSYGMIWNDDSSGYNFATNDYFTHEMASNTWTAGTLSGKYLYDASTSQMLAIAYNTERKIYHAGSSDYNIITITNGTIRSHTVQLIINDEIGWNMLGSVQFTELYLSVPNFRNYENGTTINCNFCTIVTSNNTVNPIDYKTGRLAFLGCALILDSSSTTDWYVTFPGAIEQSAVISPISICTEVIGNSIVYNTLVTNIPTVIPYKTRTYYYNLGLRGVYGIGYEFILGRKSAGAEIVIASEIHNIDNSLQCMFAIGDGWKIYEDHQYPITRLDSGTSGYVFYNYTDIYNYLYETQKDINISSVFKLDYSSANVLINTDGNVGIGTYTPQRALHIGNDYLFPALRISGNGARIEMENEAMPSGLRVVDFVGYETDLGNDHSWWLRGLADNYSTALRVWMKLRDDLIEFNPDKGFGLGKNDITFKVNALNQDNAIVVNGQSGQVGINAATNDASAQLQIDSTSRGILVPRMTTAQKIAITNPATSLLVFDTTLNCYSYYDGIQWVNVETNYVEAVAEGAITAEKIVTVGENPTQYATTVKTVTACVIDMPVGYCLENKTNGQKAKILKSGFIAAPLDIIREKQNLTSLAGAAVYYTNDGTLTFSEVSARVGTYIGEISGTHIIYINCYNSKPIEIEKFQLGRFSMWGYQIPFIPTMIRKHCNTHFAYMESNFNHVWWEIDVCDDSTNVIFKDKPKRFVDMFALDTYINARYSSERYIIVSGYLYIKKNAKIQFTKLNTGMSQIRGRSVPRYSRVNRTLQSLYNDGRANNTYLQEITNAIYQYFFSVTPPADAMKTIGLAYRSKNMKITNPNMCVGVESFLWSYMADPDIYGQYDRSTNTVVATGAPKLTLMTYRYATAAYDANKNFQVSDVLYDNCMYYTRMCIWVFVDNIASPRYYYFIIKPIDNDQILLRYPQSFPLGNSSLLLLTKPRVGKERIQKIRDVLEYPSEKTMIEWWDRVMAIDFGWLIGNHNNKSSAYNREIKMMLYNSDTGLCSEPVKTANYYGYLNGMLNVIW